MKIKNLVFVMILAVFLLTAANCGSIRFNRKELGKEGFVSLFNGKDLAGWINGPDDSWIVEDGVVTLRRQMDGLEIDSRHSHFIKALRINQLEVEVETYRQTYGDLPYDYGYIPDGDDEGMFILPAINLE